MLKGVTVLDLTTVIMGPYATSILADYGADIIKVESPQGDTTRQIPPMRNPNMGTIFLQMNRGKKSVVLNLKTADGISAFWTLLSGVDALVTNVRPAALERLGISWDTIQKVNPQLVWLSLVGFGSEGAYAGRPAYDDLIQSLTGVPSMLMQAGAQAPQFVPLSYNDRAVGLQAAIALLAGLHARNTDGRGRALEVPMFECMAEFVLGDHMGGWTFDPPLGPPGYARTLTPARRPYPTSDGHVTAIIYTDGHWRSFFDLVGQPDRFDTDPKVNSLTQRTLNSEELYGEVRTALAAGGTTAEWLERFAKADIPAAPLHTLESVIQDEHLADVGFFSDVDHPTEGRIRQLRTMVGPMGEASLQVSTPAPALGEHTEAVLRAFGADPAVIDEVLRSNAEGKGSGHGN